MDVHFEELIAPHGARIGVATLNAEKSLNALSLPMIEAMNHQLRVWQAEWELQTAQGRQPLPPQ